MKQKTKKKKKDNKTFFQFTQWSQYWKNKVPAFLDLQRSKLPQEQKTGLPSPPGAFPNHNYLQSSSVTSDLKTGRRASTSRDTQKKPWCRSLGERSWLFRRKEKPLIREALVLWIAPGSELMEDREMEVTVAVSPCTWNQSKENGWTRAERLLANTEVAHCTTRHLHAAGETGCEGPCPERVWRNAISTLEGLSSRWKRDVTENRCNWKGAFLLHNKPEDWVCIHWSWL